MLHARENCQKDTKLLSNYRSISLTQKRLATHFDHRLRDTQFGFRSGRPVTQPIPVLRRLLEVHDRQPESFHAIFLTGPKCLTLSASLQTIALIEILLLLFGIVNTPPRNLPKPLAFARDVLSLSV